jgi:hypothetical protein
VSALAFAVCLGWSAPARADEPAALFEDGADLLAQARTLYAEGTSAANLHQWERARLFFLSAWRAQHQWQIAANLGHVELALGRHRDAAEHLTIFLRETADLAAVDPRDRATLTRELSQALARVAVVTVSVDPPGAEVLVDGAPAGRAPLADPVFVEPGRHVIEARADGRRSVVASRDLGPGGAVQVTLRLAPSEGAASAPTAPRAVEAPTARGRVNKAIVIGGFAASAVALGVGAGFWARSSAAASERDTHRASCTGGDHAGCDQFDRVERTRWLTGNVAAYSLIGAGALAVATATYTLVVPRLKRPARLTGSAAPSGAALGLSLSW